jgi:hypothetical protein
MTLGEIMRRLRPSHATVVAYLALLVAMSGTAVAATGGVFVLGQPNRADRPSVLINKSGTPLELRAKPGKSPLRVNTERRVTHLNADLIDRLDSTAFLRSTGKAADADRLDGKDGAQFMSALCPDGSVSYGEAIAVGCTQLTLVSGPMQVSPSWIPSTSGRLLLCPAGQAVSGGYTLADESVRVQRSEPWGLRYTNAGWYVALFPGASQASIEASTAWALCLGPGTSNGRAYPPN